MTHKVKSLIPSTSIETNMSAADGSLNPEKRTKSEDSYPNTNLFPLFKFPR